MIKPVEPKKILCIHDLSGVGRCSLAVILPVLSVMGLQPVALPTVVLSTHTGGLGTPARLDGCAYGEAALEHIMHWAWILTAFIPATWAAKRRWHWPKKPLLCGRRPTRWWTR